jgi:SAM-dependent methyltransferase
MAVTAARPSQTARAFDAVAAEYHRSNTENPILIGMRARAVATLTRHVAPGSHVMDLGCGPGTDHAAMVQAGYRVTGIDVSEEMVREARSRAAAAGQTDSVEILHHSIDDVAQLGPPAFDAAFSNFGALNCVSDLPRAASGLHRALKPGALLVASVIGRFCPWEVLVFAARGDLSRAFVRWRGGLVPVPMRAGTVWTQYVSPARFIRTFSDSGFAYEKVQALALCVPPPYLEAFANRHPALLAHLFRLDDRIGRWPLVRAAGDHFLVVMRRD